MEGLDSSHGERGEQEGWHGGAFEPALLKETWSWVSKSLNISMDKLDSEQVVDRSFN